MVGGGRVVWTPGGVCVCVLTGRSGASSTCGATVVAGRDSVAAVRSGSIACGPVDSDGRPRIARKRIMTAAATITPAAPSASAIHTPDPDEVFPCVADHDGLVAAYGIATVGTSIGAPN